ncbi:MAG TPA: twin-arginine translocase TatA/TatE family subunit [Longimicrobiales bacterium]|nr:twin-arginine translocase TatA/TatE family subunit [Longimicrobiales bacterium]
MPGFGSVGVWEVILILAVLLLVFGAKRLPEIGSALGKGIREFKGSIKEIESEINRPERPAPRNELPRSETRPEPDARSVQDKEPVSNDGDQTG